MLDHFEREAPPSKAKPVSRVDVQLHHARRRRYRRRRRVRPSTASLFSRAQLTTRARALPVGTLLSSKP